MFPDVGGQQAADAVIRNERGEVPQQPPLGFIGLVLRLQDLIGNDLLRIQRPNITLAAINLYVKLPIVSCLYLCDVCNTLLLQQPLIKPLGLFRGHLGLVSGEEAHVLRVTTLAMGQGTGEGRGGWWKYSRS